VPSVTHTELGGVEGPCPGVGKVDSVGAAGVELQVGGQPGLAQGLGCSASRAQGGRQGDGETVKRTAQEAGGRRRKLHLPGNR